MAALLKTSAFPAFAAALALAAAPAPASAANTAKKVWTYVVKRCAASDLTGKGTLFLGMSSNYAPGDIFTTLMDRRTALFLKGSQYLPASTGSLINLNPWSTCAGSTGKKFTLGASADLKSFIPSVPVEVGANLSRARKVSVEPTEWRWEDLIVGPYQTYLRSSADAGAALNADNRAVLLRAVKVKGIKTKLTFSKADSASLKAQVLPASLNASWTSDTELTISSAEEFYIAGQLSRFVGGELMAGDDGRWEYLSYDPVDNAPQ